jgi:hypothetical protein
MKRTAPVMVIVLSLAAAGRASAQAPTATATPSKTEVGVGEPFTLDVKVSGPPGTSWTFPTEAGDDTAELRTPPPGPGKEAAAAVPADTHRYLATVFALGEVELPAVAVKYRLPDGTAGEASTAPVKVRIASTLPRDTAQQQLADIREPQPLSASLIFWLACAAATLLVAGLVVWLLRRRRRAAPAPVLTPERPADVEAREALDRLAASGLLVRGELRAYYIALAEIAKRYLERRLGSPVLEMTSAETVTFLRDHVDGHALAAPMRDLAAAADQVKFARGSALREEAERHGTVVRQMIDALEARLRPAAPPAAGKVA